jgi:hypothetical protein
MGRWQSFRRNGTGGSNPVSSSGESTANLTSAQNPLLFGETKRSRTNDKRFRLLPNTAVNGGG